jgi:predicted transposase YdaD
MSNTPHDRLFKSVFSEPKNAVAHFAACLPPALVAALDLSKAQHMPGSWVDESLREHHSDVAHVIPLKSSDGDEAQTQSALLYTIWEHQSSVDRLMALRAHRYTTRLLEDWSREHPGERLPPVIVMVLYHGEAEWTAPVELEGLFALDGLTPETREALRPYLPKQRYLLEVVPGDPAEVRSGPGSARITLLALKFGHSAELWTAVFESEDDLHALPEGTELLHLLEQLVEYLMTVNPALTAEQLSEALRPMGTEAQELPKTYLSRMVEQGLQKGREEGRRERNLEVARKALAKGMSPQDVAELTDLPLEEVQKLAH